MNHGGSNLSPGNYRLEKFVIHSLLNSKTVDMRNLFSRIEIYEDLFSPYISANLYIEDSFNFPERLPIVGHEKVELSFKSDISGFPLVELVFRVYKLDQQKIGENGKTQEYTLHLVSEGGYFNNSQYCGYALSGPVSDMVRSVFTKHFPEPLWKDRLYIESTKDKYSFVVSAAYNPFKAVSWLSTKATARSGNEYSPYLFYESIDGHRFVSLSTLIEQGYRTDARYFYTTANIGIVEAEKQSLGFSSPLPTRYHKIQRLEELSRFDAVSNTMSGMVSSMLGVHDLVRKQVRTYEIFEKDLFSSAKKLGDQPHYKTGDPDASRFTKRGAVYFYQPSTPFTVYSSKNQIKDNFRTEELYLRRNYHMNAIFTQKLVIEIFGDSRRRVGDVITIVVAKPQSDVTGVTDKSDRNLSGEYIVTGVKHVLGKAYSCKLEISRNGMGV